MKKYLNQIIEASKQVLSSKNYLIGFLAFTFLMLFVFVLIPVLLIPGNGFLFQLTVFSVRDYFLMGILSMLTALLLNMQVFMYNKSKVLNLGKGALGSYSGFAAAMFGTASCSSCVAAVFGYLGVGTVFFLIDYQWVVVLIASGIMLVSLYFTSKKLNGACDSCQK